MYTGMKSEPLSRRVVVASSRSRTLSPCCNRQVANVRSSSRNTYERKKKGKGEGRHHRQASIVDVCVCVFGFHHDPGQLSDGHGQKLNTIVLCARFELS